MGAGEFSDFASQYGPFVALGAVVIVAMAAVIRALWHRLNEQIDKRFVDHETHSQQMADVTKTLDHALKFVEGSGRG
jgi:hypothetical protein